MYILTICRANGNILEVLKVSSLTLTKNLKRVLKLLSITHLASENLPILTLRRNRGLRRGRGSYSGDK
jgi:hypothetical protein